MQTVKSDKDIISTGKKVFDIEINELYRVKENVDLQFSKAVHTILDCKGRIVVTGVGKSGIIGHKISASLASTGTHSVYMNAAEGLHGDLGMINYNDIVLAISNSGTTSEIVQLLPSIKKIGAKIIALTGNVNSPLGKEADLVLNIGIEEEACPLNIVPTSSTTATLLMGDALVVALLKKRNFQPEDFALYHPGGTLGRRLLTQVADVMNPIENVSIGNKGDSLLTIVDKLTRKNIGVVPIEEESKIIGIITDGDIRRALKNYKDKFFNMIASDIMTNNFKYITRERKALEALEMMENKKISCLPVLNSGKLEGIVKLHDIYDVTKFQKHVCDN